MSTNTGSAPSNLITSAVAMYVNGVVIILSPGEIPLAIRAISKASVPDEQDKQYLALTN